MRHTGPACLVDKAGSFGTMASILGKHGVSISAATQKVGDAAKGDYVPVVMLTHPAKASCVDAALAEIVAAGVLDAAPVKLRML